MAEVVTVVAKKPTVTELTLKLSAGEARDQLAFIEAYYQRAGWMGPADRNPIHRVISDALAGVKPKFDGINVANGKVAIS